MDRCYISLINKSNHDTNKGYLIYQYDENKYEIYIGDYIEVSWGTFEVWGIVKELSDKKIVLDNRNIMITFYIEDIDGMERIQKPTYPEWGI